MKKTINGLRYDTGNAIEVGGYSHGNYSDSGDFSHWSAILYRTPRSGRFFLYGNGGAMTRFAKHSPFGGSCGGSKLIPMSDKEALAWAEKYLDQETIDEHFADMVEDA